MGQQVDKNIYFTFSQRNYWKRQTYQSVKLVLVQSTPKIAFHLVKVFYKDSFLCVLGGEGGVQNKVTEESKGFKEFLTSLLTSKHDRLNETHITLNLFVILKL